MKEGSRVRPPLISLFYSENVLICEKCPTSAKKQRLVGVGHSLGGVAAATLPHQVFDKVHPHTFTAIVLVTHLLLLLGTHLACLVPLWCRGFCLFDGFR